MRNCNFCINKESCDKCDKYGDKFIPEERVRKYFSSYNSRWDEKSEKYISNWSWNSTSEKLIPTQYIQLGYNEICPYCGGKMFPIQDKKTLDHIGHCCICEGAEAELQYELDKEELLKEQKKQLEELKNKYKDKLKYDSKKLFEMKRERDLKEFEQNSKDNRSCNYFSSINGRKVANINDILEWSTTN